ncbi:MAG: dienelactone hydrolase family protein [Anaerolineae bacterium]|nr:dienelactone hydrolase family protein [Anaerolineae bacterium]
MPLYNPDHVEYNITTGRIQIAIEDGTSIPAYWAHPTITAKFPGIALIHDWWGITDHIRQVANQFAQVGHYVIVPDLFNGETARSYEEALTRLDELGDAGYKLVHTALSVLENHHQCNGDVAAVGYGMGGSLAFEAAIIREDLEAAVAYAGFPQRYLGYFHRSNTPMLAFYGSNEQYISPEIIERLRKELATASDSLAHEVVILPGVAHDMLSPDAEVTAQMRQAWHKTLDFLDDLLEGPNRPPEMKAY